MKFLKQRKIQVGLAVVLLLLVGGYFLVFGKSQTKAPEPGPQEEVVEEISASVLGLTITAKPDNKAVKFAIEKPEGIKTIEYELTYEADSTAAEISEGGEDRVQRGITGEVEIENDSETYESPWLDLGSCSKNVCRYDAGVESVDLTLKIVKSDGKTYLATESLEL